MKQLLNKFNKHFIKSNYFYYTIAFVITLLLTNTYSFGIVKTDYTAAILIEANSGKIMYQYNKDLVLPQASITKLMTYYVTKGYLEAHKIKETDSTIIKNANFTIPEDGVKLGIKNGQVYTYKDLIKAMLVMSANDSACEFENIYDTNTGEDIIASMNKASKELGFKNSHYYNVTGITIKHGNKSLYNTTTAYELSKLAALLIKKYPHILDVTSLKKIVINNHTFYSTNKLLSKVKEVDGLKTGHTDEAGYCLVFTENVKHTIGNGKPMRLIGVVLGCKSDRVRTKSTMNLLKYADENYFNFKLLDKNKVYTFNDEFYKNNKIEGFIKSDSFMLLEKQTSIANTNYRNKSISGTIHKGDIIGLATVKAGSKTISTPIYANKDYKQKFILIRALIHIKNFFEDIF